MESKLRCNISVSCMSYYLTTYLNSNFQKLNRIIMLNLVRNSFSPLRKDEQNCKANSQPRFYKRSNQTSLLRWSLKIQNLHVVSLVIKENFFMNYLKFNEYSQTRQNVVELFIFQCLIKVIDVYARTKQESS